jgi:hypothetical protein
VALEGAVNAKLAASSLARGELPQGDLIPWTIGQQYQVRQLVTLCACVTLASDAITSLSAQHWISCSLIQAPRGCARKGGIAAVPCAGFLSDSLAVCRCIFAVVVLH